MPGRLRHHLLDHPYLLLAATMVMWAGNAIAARLAVGHVSPMVLITMRWLIACSALALVAHRTLAADWRKMRPHWLLLAVMGVSGFTAFNALFYLSAYHTTAVNITILQGAIPIFVLIGALVAFGTAIHVAQVLGMAITLVGILVLAARGDIGALLALDFNIGDIFMLIACALYAGYTLALRYRPAVAAISSFTAMALAAAVTSLPMLGMEIALGHSYWPTPRGWLIILYVALFPSLLAQMSFIRGVELIGPGRAGLFVNLVPVFGAFLAVVILAEPFGVFHALALALVLGGIYLAERHRE